MLNDADSQRKAIADAYARQFIAHNKGKGLSRGDVKQPVMTFPYGATLFGWGEQVYSSVFEPDIDLLTEDLITEEEFLGLQLKTNIRTSCVAVRSNTWWKS